MVSDRWGYPALFLITSLIAALAGVLALAMKTETRAVAPHVAGKRKISLADLFAFEAFGITVLVIFFTAATSTITNFLVIFGKDRGIEGIGYYFTIYAAVLIAIRWFGGKLIDKYPFRRIVYVCTVLCVAGLVVIGSAQSFTALGVAAVLLGVGYGILLPALQTAIVRSVPDGRKGAAGATFYIGMDAAYIVGPLAMGFIAETFGYTAGFFALCGPMLASVPLAAYFGRTNKKPV
jgi:MFS family permease